MFVVLGYYKRGPDLTHEQFSHHWRNVHGPLMRKIAEKDPYLVRYVQHHLSPDTSYVVDPNTKHDSNSEGYDGFSEAWFVSEEARDKWANLPIFKSEGIEDEKQFLDLAATRWVVRDEQHVIIAGPGQPI